MLSAPLAASVTVMVCLPAVTSVAEKLWIPAPQVAVTEWLPAF